MKRLKTKEELVAEGWEEFEEFIDGVDYPAIQSAKYRHVISSAPEGGMEDLGKYKSEMEPDVVIDWEDFPYLWTDES